MQGSALTQAFQTALGMLITNESMADGMIAGKLPLERAHPDLTAPDIAALRALLKADGRRIHAVSRLTTQRRKRRLFSMLPLSVHLLKPGIEKYWHAYLDAEATHGARPAFEDAAAFAASLLEQTGDSPAAPFIRFESCLNEIAGRLDSKAVKNGPPLDKAYARLRLSRFVRIERFDFAIDEALREFRALGTLRTDWPDAPIHLVFHPLRAQPPRIIATRLPSGLAEALHNSRHGDGMDVHALSEAAPAELRPDIEQMIARLVTMRVLEDCGPGE